MQSKLLFVCCQSYLLSVRLGIGSNYFVTFDFYSISFNFFFRKNFFKQISTRPVNLFSVRFSKIKCSVNKNSGHLG